MFNEVKFNKPPGWTPLPPSRPHLPSAADRWAERGCVGLCPYNLQAPPGPGLVLPKTGPGLEEPLHIYKTLTTMALFFDWL